VYKKREIMKKFEEKALEQIVHLADDIELGDDTPKRDAFILEFQSAVKLMRNDDWDQFYAFADIIMQRYN
jgi:glutathione synthase/RimK-type ligase-like ATP-grasp enzyme